MYLITNRHLCKYDRYIEVIKEASYCGVKNIILREKDLSNDELEDLYFRIKKNINKETKLIINSNIEVFKRVDADGIHLPFDKFIDIYDEKNKENTSEYIDIKNFNKLLGVSTHSIKDIVEVLKRNADYIFLSHIYETKCKENLKPKGIEILKEANSLLTNSNINLIALGGITPSNVKYIVDYCDDIAVMSTIMSSKNIEKTISEYRLKVSVLK